MCNSCQPTCLNSKCQNLVEYSNRYKKYSLYCCMECRRTHEDNTWQEFVDNSPMCNTQGCNNRVEAKRHNGNRTYTKTCSLTCLQDTRKANAPHCKLDLCDNKTKYNDAKSSYNLFCCEDCKKSYRDNIKQARISNAPKCRNVACNNLAYPKDKGEYSEYCCFECWQNEFANKRKEFEDAALKCKYINCDNRVISKYTTTYTEFC